MQHFVSAGETVGWRQLLDRMPRVDPTCLPEYHRAYALRVPGAKALLWHYAEDGADFLYPFLLTPVMLEGKDQGWSDISSVYGYSGPMSNSSDAGFVSRAWRAFDAEARNLKVLAEFVRFSPYAENHPLAHPDSQVTPNRSLAVSRLPRDESQLLAALGPKTRNMLRKAARANLTGRELALPAHLPEFRALYAETMRRNAASDFFWYDDAYWEALLALGPQAVRLFATLDSSRMVAASMAIAHGPSAVYHLGASMPEAARLGAGNLSLFTMSTALAASGVDFLNMTGGRSSRDDDPLLLFKRSNATGTAPFLIGRRVLDAAAYNDLRAAWEHAHHAAPDDTRLIFWRP